MKAREQPSYMQSETLKLIQEQEKNGFQKKPQQEPIQQQQIKSNIINPRLNTIN